MAPKVKDILENLPPGDQFRAIVERLVESVPEIRQLFEGHLAENEGETSSYLFFGDLARWAAERFVSLGREDAALVRLLGHLEALLKDGEPEIQSLVVVGFVEELIDLDGPSARILDLLGPRMSAEVGPLRELWREAGGTLAGVIRLERGKRSG